VRKHRLKVKTKRASRNPIIYPRGQRGRIEKNTKDLMPVDMSGGGGERPKGCSGTSDRWPKRGGRKKSQKGPSLSRRLGGKRTKKRSWTKIVLTPRFFWALPEAGVEPGRSKETIGLRQPKDFLSLHPQRGGSRRREKRNTNRISGQKPFVTVFTAEGGGWGASHCKSGYHKVTVPRLE